MFRLLAVVLVVGACTPSEEPGRGSVEAPANTSAAPRMWPGPPHLNVVLDSLRTHPMRVVEVFATQGELLLPLMHHWDEMYANVPIGQFVEYVVAHTQHLGAEESIYANMALRYQAVADTIGVYSNPTVVEWFQVQAEFFQLARDRHTGIRSMAEHLAAGVETTVPRKQVVDEFDAWMAAKSRELAELRDRSDSLLRQIRS